MLLLAHSHFTLRMPGFTSNIQFQLIREIVYSPEILNKILRDLFLATYNFLILATFKLLRHYRHAL